jgi:chemotaxis protein MotB
MSESNSHPPVIIKKVKKGGGHHGGAWKVAYADFVTAMMALFIVLWLLSSDEKVKKAVGGYFQDPEGSGNLMGSTLAGSGLGIEIQKEDMTKLREALEKAMQEVPRFQTLKDQIEFTITGEGLRIELLETEKGTFFESGNAQPSESGKELLKTLAAELGKLSNLLLIEGHTDSRPFSSEQIYSNWELSSDRANAARRLMQESGLRPDQVKQVRGFADQKLRTPKDPENASNRRISVLVQYLAQTTLPAEAAKSNQQGGSTNREPPAPAGHAAKPAPAKP